MTFQLTDYVATYKKDPFGVSFNVDTMKNGAYYIKGKVSDDLWFKACKQIDVPASGKCSVECVIEKKGNVLKLHGDIKTQMSRICVRTLKEFDESEKLHFDEELFISEAEDNELTEVLHGSILEIKDYLVQQIILHMNIYPIHPDTLSSKKGEFDLKDGQEEAQKREKEQKNPFSVLKDLKSSS